MKTLCLILVIFIMPERAFCQDSTYLLKLSEAENLWNLQNFSSYSYTLKNGGAFGFSLYRISFKNGKCTAKSKAFLRNWKTDVCSRHTMPEVFTEFRRQLNFGTESVRAEFDPELGYLKSLYLEPKTDLTDQSWYVEVTNFKAKK